MGPSVETIPAGKDLLKNPREAFLRSTVKLEPLVDRWYAWPHLLSPATQAMNLAYRYLPMIKSFAAAPAVHVSANRDPAMFGGPFVDLPETAASEAKDYIRRIEATRVEALSFARQYRTFDHGLRSFKDGASLDTARMIAPEELQGRIDVAYDLRSNPKVRVLEEMFDNDDLGLSRAQEILLHSEGDTERPFFLSAPRLQSNGTFLKAPFGSDSCHTLFRSRWDPIDLVETARRLGADLNDLAPYFADTPSMSKGVSYQGDGVRLRYFGHASLLIESARTTILVDPTFSLEPIDGLKHLTIEDLPQRIDFLFITHCHQDHFSPEALLSIRERVGVVVVPANNRGELSDPSMKRMLAALGFKSIIALDTLEALDVPEGRITALPFSGEHGDLDIHSKQCLLLELKGRKICVLADTDAIDLNVYERLQPRLMNPDLLLIGMECFGAPVSWLYGPLIAERLSARSDSSRRLSGADSERAWRLTQALAPRRALIYAMGQEPWLRYLMGLNYREDSVQLVEVRKFLGLCAAEGVSAEHLYLDFTVEL